MHRLHLLLIQKPYGIGQFVLKVWAKIQMGSRGSCRLNTCGVRKNWRFSRNISLYFASGTRYGHIVRPTMEDEKELEYDLLNYLQ